MIDDLKPYPKMKDSGVPWLEEVPEHWEARRLKYTFRRIVGGSTPSSADPACWGGDIVWVTPADISKASRLKDSHRRITRDGLAACSAELVPPGSIVVTSRAPVGSVAIADIELCTNQGCKALVPELSRIDPMYGFHVLGTLKGELQSLATGTTFTEISTSRIGDVRVPVPPLPEQTTIVRFLDHADRRVRRYIRAKQKLIKLLEELKAAIIHRAVTRGLDPNVRLKPSGVEWLGDVPEHWEVRRLKSLVMQIDQGVSPQAENYLAEGPSWGVLKAGCVNRGVFREEQHKRLPTGFSFDPTLAITVGDVLVSRASGSPNLVGSVGRVHSLRHQLILSDKTFRPRFRESVDPDFMVLAMNSPYYREQVRQAISGAEGLANNLPLSSLRSFRFAVPRDLAEQQLIAREVSATTSGLQDAVLKAERAINLLREYRTRLIADVVTGKLDVRETAARLPQDAEDLEPLDEPEALGDASDESAGDGLDPEPEEAEA